MNRVLYSSSGAMINQVAHGKRLVALAKRFLKRLSIDRAELSLTLVDNRRIRAINRRWRGKDTPTDVISFPGGESVGPGLRQLGDIVISFTTAKKAARDFDSTLEHELALYLAHGLLHLLGFDHLTPRDARAMQRQEAFLLGHTGMLSRSDEVD